MISVTVKLAELSQNNRQPTGGTMLDVYVVDTSDIRIALMSALDAAGREYPFGVIQGVECGCTLGKVIPPCIAPRVSS